MGKKQAKLARIENNEPISMESHYEFLYQLQHVLLLALRERGSLSPMQLRHAQEQLNRHRRERAKRRQEKT